MNVLFLCTGNSARSQMAEGFLQSKGSEGLEVHSAGTWPGREVHPLAVQVMSEKGIDISKYRPKAFTTIPRPIDLLVAVCGQAADECPHVPGALTLRWDLDDPASFSGTDDEKLEGFRRIRDEIEQRIDSLVANL